MGRERKLYGESKTKIFPETLVGGPWLGNSEWKCPPAPPPAPPPASVRGITPLRFHFRAKWLMTNLVQNLFKSCPCSMVFPVALPGTAWGGQKERAVENFWPKRLNCSKTKRDTQSTPIIKNVQPLTKGTTWYFVPASVTGKGGKIDFFFICRDNASDLIHKIKA